MLRDDSAARRVMQIVIDFRSPPGVLFQSIDCCTPHTNVPATTVQPDQGFDLSFGVKSPGDRFTLQTQRMQFRYAGAFGTLWDGYQTPLPEVMQGDQMLLVHADETEAAWRLYNPLLQRRSPAHLYPTGGRQPRTGWYACRDMHGRTRKHSLRPCTPSANRPRKC